MNLANLASKGVPEAAAALHRLGIDAPLRAADAAAVAAGRCPLGDVAAQKAAIDKWEKRPLAAVRAAAEGGDLAAQCVLGGFFNQGAKGAPKDDVQAVLWWRRSAAGNVAEAQTSLGFMHYHGKGGLAVDLADAARLYALAAAQGLAHAQHNLGNCYRMGKGVPRDLAEAARLFRLAAEQGDASAQSNLATAYIFGDGVAVDYAAAMQLARRSVDQGNAVGEYIVAVLYKNGWGVPQDLRAATLWFVKAATRGDEDAKKRLLELAAAGVPEAAAAVRRLRLAL